MSNPQLEDGHTRIANEILDQLGKTELNGYESRIIWVLFRKTYGFQKKADWISNSQFVEATGILKQNVSRTIIGLKARHIILADGHQLSFNKNYTEWLSKMITAKKLSKMITKVIGNDYGSNQIRLPQKKLIQKKKESTLFPLTPKIEKPRKYSQPEDLTEADFLEIAKLNKVKIAFVKGKFDKLVFESKNGRVVKNFKTALNNWVSMDYHLEENKILTQTEKLEKLGVKICQ